MKNLFLFILFFPLSAPAQRSGIPEQDALLLKKDCILFLNMVTNNKYQLEYDWLDFQWQQWVRGKKERRCVYEVRDWSSWGSPPRIVIGDCPGPGEVIMGYLRDTMVHIPLPISFEAFMDWKIAQVVHK